MVNGLAIGWKLMLVVGVGAMFTGLQLFLAPDPHIQTSGMSLAQIEAVSPRLAGWALHASQEATFSLVLLGLTIATISATAYRSGERWSWFLLAALTLGYIVANVTIHLSFGDTTYFPLVFSQLAIALAGLALPFRHILLRPS